MQTQQMKELVEHLTPSLPVQEQNKYFCNYLEF